MSNESAQKYRLVGKSDPMKEVYELINKIANINVTVLIIGESGTGKELVARDIHQKSQKKDGPFVPVNCVAIPDGLLESELFGHKEGAFTGATRSKKGKFEMSNGGTLFLDEIGDMNIGAQSKFLRVIEEGKFERVGGEKTHEVDNRIIAATNRDLLKHVKEGKFRDDLYYRLNEVRIKMPPLRERKEDIPLLINYFVDIFNEDFNKEVEGISDTALNYLMKHDWPGNVRELRNVIKRAIALMETDTIWLEHLPVEIKIHTEDVMLEDREMSLEEVEAKHIKSILEKARWNKSKAARILDISRHRLNRKIDKYNLKEEEKE